MEISLYYLSDNTTGGWVTYTSHLIYGLREIPGVKVNLCKVRPRNEARPRPFGYGVTYENVDLDNAVKRLGKGPGLIVALQKNYRDHAKALVENGSWLVVHDPAEFKHTDLSSCGGRCITIRKAVAAQVAGSKFIHHPYKRYYIKGTISKTEVRACSIARIDFDKNTNLILDANRILPENMKIQINGFDNRIYTRFKLCPQYPEYKQSVSHYPRERDAAVKICNRSVYSVDMSLINGDGGGTQYTFMEAMDAGSVNVIHSGWIIEDDEMVPYPKPGANCIAAGCGEELADIIRSGPMLFHRRNIVRAGECLLKRHEPGLVANSVLGVLKGN